ncbi:MAG: aminoglycoside phosphotransferase family protein [Chitinophagaceae bacterium]|nr:MAG: aminoglycoside phosphotransferase family protein [Chitinophagaceae bacterium]
MEKVLHSFGFNKNECTVKAFGTGLINHTWVVENDNKFILQKVNHNVFKQPEDIGHNISSIINYLKDTKSDYFLATPLVSIENKTILFIEGEGYFRMFQFVTGSHSKDTLSTPDEAYEAAKQFGKFTKSLSGIDVSQLKITLADFHNLEFRYHQFTDALKNGNTNRIKAAKEIINELLGYEYIVDEYKQICNNPEFKLRVTHHDTKISNVLFNDDNKGICVIDLDTVMPGYFISDIGDMMRTYLCPVSEEEKDFSKIEVRDDFYKSIVKGYGEEMNEFLTDTEKKYYFYAGVFMIYMQALRFITDHLNDDIYYGAKYEGHNYVRGCNQLRLLQCLLIKEESLKKII